MVSFYEAVKLALQRYTDFRGRSTKAEFWWWVLFYYGANIGAAVIDSFLTAGVLGILVFLGLIIPYWAVAVRRLHDTNRSGWWILVGLLPLVGIILLLVFFLQPSNTWETNKYNNISSYSEESKPQYCPQCGSTVRLNSTFCALCGHSIEAH